MLSWAITCSVLSNMCYHMFRSSCDAPTILEIKKQMSWIACIHFQESNTCTESYFTVYTKHFAKWQILVMCPRRNHHTTFIKGQHFFHTQYLINITRYVNSTTMWVVLQNSSYCITISIFLCRFLFSRPFSCSAHEARNLFFSEVKTIDW